MALSKNEQILVGIIKSIPAGSPLAFDEAWYKSTTQLGADMENLISKGDVKSPLEYFVKYGQYLYGETPNHLVNITHIEDVFYETEDASKLSKWITNGGGGVFGWYVLAGSRQGVGPNSSFVSLAQFDKDAYVKRNDINGNRFKSAEDAYYHYLRKGLAQGLVAVKKNGNTFVVPVPPATESTGAAVPASSTSQSVDPITGTSATPVVSAGTQSNSTSGDSGSSGGGSDGAWDGTYSVETTGASDGWDTGNGWSATGVAALQRQALWYEPGTGLYGVESTQGNAF